MSLPRNNRQHRILKPRSVRDHLPELFPDRRDLAFDPDLVVRVEDERLRHATCERLFGGGRRSQVEQELEEDEVLD
jgi:hypothetical protein